MNEITKRTPVLIASEINSIKEQTQRMLLINSIEIGRRLVEAKSMIPHGEWGKWLEESVDYSQSTANNLMKIFEQYGDSQLSIFGSNVKSQTFANLSYSQAVALLGVPEEEREQFVKENNAEKLSARELQKLIKEKKELKKQLEESQLLAKKEQEAREKLSKELEQLESQKKSLDATMQKLNEELEKAKSTGNEEKVEELQEKLDSAYSELSDSKLKIKELEQHLKEKPIEVQAVIEKVPEEIEKELVELRKKVGQKENKSIIKFSVHFESLVKGFNDLLIALKDIPESEQPKYKNAVNGLINKMAERL